MRKIKHLPNVLVHCQKGAYGTLKSIQSKYTLSKKESCHMCAKYDRMQLIKSNLKC